jgi:hypothetical protein
MGLRLRLKADFDLSPFSKTSKAILQAMKTYGLILADNGGDWFVSGSPDPRSSTRARSSAPRINT